MYVVDTLNNRIQVFTAEGKFLRIFGKHGIGGREELKLPYGVALDPSGIVYVSKHMRQRIFIYTSKGQFMTDMFWKEGERTRKTCQSLWTRSGQHWSIVSHSLIPSMVLV